MATPHRTQQPGNNSRPHRRGAISGIRRATVCTTPLTAAAVDRTRQLGIHYGLFDVFKPLDLRLLRVGELFVNGLGVLIMPLSLPGMAGLGQGILQGQQTVQNNKLNQIDMEIKKLQLETMRSQQALQQATAARQQGADAAAAGVLQQYYGAKQQAPQAPPAVNMPPPPVQSPQTPQAGQASQPMMQPGQQPPPIP